MTVIQTPRLVLRQWQPDDFASFARLNADPNVMRYFPSTRTASQSAELVTRFSEDIEQLGWGFWAAERRDTRTFIGFIGINQNLAGLPFAPCVDIGWRLASEHWGLGFASEGARAAMDYAFTEAQLDKVVSMTPVINKPSERVMQKLGMQKDSNNFMHPKLPAGHTLREHVLYTCHASDWLKSSLSLA